MEPYSHQQKQSAGLYVGMAVGIGILAVACLYFFNLFAYLPFSPLWIFAAIIVVVIAIIFYANYLSSLTISVDDHMITWYFSNNTLKQQLPLSDIASVSVIRYGYLYLLKSGGGVGYNTILGAKVYAAYGSKYVDIVKKDGTKFVLGTDEPDLLKQAIDSRIATASPQLAQS